MMGEVGERDAGGDQAAGDMSGGLSGRNDVRPPLQPLANGAWRTGYISDTSVTVIAETLPAFSERRNSMVAHKDHVSAMSKNSPLESEYVPTSPPEYEQTKYLTHRGGWSTWERSGLQPIVEYLQILEVMLLGDTTRTEDVWGKTTGDAHIVAELLSLLRCEKELWFFDWYHGNDDDQEYFWPSEHGIHGHVAGYTVKIAYDHAI